MRARAILLLSLFMGAVPLLSTPSGRAQPAPTKPSKPAKPAPPPALDVKGIQDKIKGGDSARVLEGLGQAQAGGAQAQPLAPAIEELLKKGTSAPIAKSALEALGAIGATSSSAVIRPYIRHRTQEIRRAAVRALGGSKGAEALAAYKEGLRTDDGMVRGFSATGLGNMGASEALPDLFLALDRNVTEAAAAIGQLCEPADCEKFAGKLGRIGFDVMTSGFDPILFRQKPLPDDALLKVVGRLRELGTPESAKYLADVQSRWPATGSKKVKQAIDTAITSIPGGAK